MSNENNRYSEKHYDEYYPSRVVVEERNVGNSECKCDTEAQYTCFLDFKNENDERDYRRWLKGEMSAPAFWTFVILICGIDVSRIILTYYVNSSPIFTASLIVQSCGWIVFFLYFFTHYDKLVTIHIRQYYSADTLKSVTKLLLRYIRIDAENLCAIALISSSCLFLIGRVLSGKCGKNLTYMQSYGCNPSTDSGEPPTQTILLLYICPLAMQVCVKGISKNFFFVFWILSSAAVAYGVLTLRGYVNSWDLLYSLFVLITMYETERLKISTFLQRKYALNYETKKREIAEDLYDIREHEVNKIDTIKTEFEAIAQHREFILKKLPLHKGIIDRVEQDTLLSLIAEYIDTAKLLDYDGNTAFTLILNYHDADVRAVTQLLMNSLPVDPMTQLPVDESTHLYAWTRAVQYEKYEKAIVFVLSLYPSIAVQLSVAEDREGRQVVHIASPKCKKAIMRYLLFFQRYEILTLAQPHYKVIFTLKIVFCSIFVRINFMIGLCSSF
jgi:hypothetical protein